MNLYSLVFLAVISASFSGCSNKQIYEAIQKNRQFECQTLQQVDYEECIKDSGESYESYREAIDEAVEL